MVHSTGHYIFGDDYAEELFQDFWQELKTYKPKYTDSHNRSLYFSLDKAGQIHNNFYDIFNKYRDRYRNESNLRKIQYHKKELAKLEKEGKITEI